MEVNRHCFGTDILNISCDHTSCDLETTVAVAEMHAGDALTDLQLVSVSPRHDADPIRLVPALSMHMACLLMPRSSPKRLPEVVFEPGTEGRFQHIQLPCVLVERPLFTPWSGGAEIQRQGGGPQGASWPDCASENLFCETHSSGGRPDVATRMSSPFTDRGPITSVMSSCSPASVGAPSRGRRRWKYATTSAGGG